MSHYNPDQFTEQQSGLTPHTLENDLADYIDTQVIAQYVVEEMKDQGVELTLEGAKRVYLDALENLPTQLTVSVECLEDQ